MEKKIQTIINGKKMEFKPYDYGLTIIAEVLEMLRKSFMFISVDIQFDSSFYGFDRLRQRFASRLRRRHRRLLRFNKADGLNPSALSIQTVKYQLSPQTTKSARSPRRVSPPLSFAAAGFRNIHSIRQKITLLPSSAGMGNRLEHRKIHADISRNFQKALQVCVAICEVSLSS